MKWLQVYRLGWKLGIYLLFAYVAEKIFRRQIFRDQQAIIVYFNQLVNGDLHHVRSYPDYFVVKSDNNGLLAIRKYPSSDAKVYQQVFRDQEYAEVCRLIKKHIAAKDISMIDGGANVGFTSIYVQKKIEPEYQLHSILVEPSEKNAEMIRINAGLQKINLFNIEIAGIHNRKGYLALSNSFRDGLEWSVQVKESTEVTTIQAVEITELINKYGYDIIDVLKLDIEGAEKGLFTDPEYAASFLKRVRIIAIELHPESIQPAEVLNILKNCSFNLSRFGELYIGINTQLN